ncbi:c-type cytochrome, partial [Myxococcota bacterium]|nr:c-type cytochrome [Myxococcota bacterium]
ELDAAAPSDAPLEPALARRWTLGPALRFSDAALRGRASFFDAVNTHLTPSGVVTCGTCHPDGGDDGLVWFLHTRTVPRKLRRTPPAWAAKRALAPYHWDAELADASTLSRGTIVGLMEGDGLVVDTDAIAAYLDEQPFPPPQPVRDAAAWARGRALFESTETACATCHPAPLFADGLRHDVVPLGDDADAALRLVDTPSLRGARARPPYLHDGRAKTLRDVLTSANAEQRHGATSSLSDADLDALVEYLETL